MNTLNFKNDFWGHVVHYLKKRKELFVTSVLQVRCLLMCRMEKVSLGRKVIFIGKPVVERYPESEITIGSNVTIRSDNYTYQEPRKAILRTRIKGAHIKIGQDCGLNGVVLSAAKRINIGNNVLLGFGTKIIDYDGHDFMDHSKRGKIKEVFIDDNVFVGMHCVILKGVHIGENTVIGANSVVSKSIPANVIAAGNPCKIIRRLQ